MVSQSVVISDKDEISNIFTKYSNKVDELNNPSIWDGVSNDNAISQMNNFVETYKSPIEEQMSSLSKAAGLVLDYNNTKKDLKDAQDAYNALEDKQSNTAQSLLNKIETAKTDVDNLKKEINNLIDKIVSLSINNVMYDDYGIIIKDDGVPRNGTAAEKLAFLFPEGVPTSSNEASKYMVKTEVEYIDVNGERKTATIRVHQKLEQDVKEIFSKIADTGFQIKPSSGDYIESYYWKEKTGASGRSQHSYGAAIDLNPGDNPLTGNSRENTQYDPDTNQYAVTEEVANIFRSYGWSWGGSDWGSNKRGTRYDYMHFDFTELGPQEQK